MRGELEAMASGLHSLGVECCIVGWKPPTQSLGSTLVTEFVSPRFESLINLLPPRVGVRLLEFQVYRKAFAEVQRTGNSVVIGLTASGPFGPAMAAVCAKNIPPTILITRHTGGAPQSRRSPWRLAFEALAKRGVAFGAYSTTVEQTLRTMLPRGGGLIRHLPEVIADTPKGALEKPTRPRGVLLVSGMDSVGRRAPISHLMATKVIPFDKVILHDPSGRFVGCDDLQNKHGSAVSFERVSSYFTDDFPDFLQKGSAVLVAYDPAFINPSSVLRHSLSAGVPSISTRFPDSDFLVAKFGLVGELWDFGSAKSMALAINRFTKWQKKDFDMLESSSHAIRAWANPVASASALLDFAMAIRSSTGRLKGTSQRDFSDR
jgi:hypothetical protein